MKQNQCRSAITLIEVVVGLALLGTLLTTILVSAGRYQKILIAAQEKLKAQSVLDRLVTDFYRQGFPKSHVVVEIPTYDNWVCKVDRRPWIDSPEHFDIGRVVISNRSRQNFELATVELLLPK